VENNLSTMKKEQKDTLEFDGVSSQGLGGSNNGKYAGNHSGETMKANYGRPTEALKGASFGKEAGPSTAKGGKIDGGRKWEPAPCETQNYRGNADKINIGRPITKGNPKG
jgi:hypothetical protein